MQKPLRERLFCFYLDLSASSASGTTFDENHVMKKLLILPLLLLAACSKSPSDPPRVLTNVTYEFSASTGLQGDRAAIQYRDSTGTLRNDTIVNNSGDAITYSVFLGKMFLSAKPVDGLMRLRMAIYVNRSRMVQVDTFTDGKAITIEY
jgi:hypothetical protein